MSNSESSFSGRGAIALRIVSGGFLESDWIFFFSLSEVDFSPNDFFLGAGAPSSTESGGNDGEELLGRPLKDEDSLRMVF